MKKTTIRLAFGSLEMRFTVSPVQFQYREYSWTLEEIPRLYTQAFVGAVYEPCNGERGAKQMRAPQFSPWDEFRRLGNEHLQ